MTYYLHYNPNSDSIYNQELHSLYKNLNHLFLYTHTSTHPDSIFSMNYIHFHSIHIYTHVIHAQLNILFHPLLILSYILLESFFYFIWNASSSIWTIDRLKFPTHLLMLTVNG